MPSAGVMHAFGLDIEADFPLLGAAPDAAPGPRRHVRIELTERDRLRQAWRPAAPRRVSVRRLADGRIASSIDADPQCGYLLRASGFGTYLISADGNRIRCAPLQKTPWRWQRFLTARPLPLAALLQGVEVFHASAVAGPAGAYAFVGASTAGKTTLAINLACRGARFLTDDVLALSVEDGTVVAHPGVAIASLRHAAADVMGPEHQRRVGRVIGRDRNALRIAVEHRGDAAPLRHLYLLERSSEVPDLVIDPLPAVDPRLLLASTFVFVDTTPGRLVNQLDVCARIARSVAVLRLRIPPSAGAGEVADVLWERIRSDAA